MNTTKDWSSGYKYQEVRNERLFYKMDFFWPNKMAATVGTVGTVSSGREGCCLRNSAIRWILVVSDSYGELTATGISYLLSFFQLYFRCFFSHVDF